MSGLGVLAMSGLGVAGLRLEVACWFPKCPHRLVVRTSRCGRDSPGPIPGVDIWARAVCNGVCDICEMCPHQESNLGCRGHDATS